jgi:hypothetical protein
MDAGIAYHNHSWLATKAVRPHLPFISIPVKPPSCLLLVAGVKAEGRKKLAEKRAQEQAQLEKRAARAKSISRGTPRPKQR